MKLFMKKMTIYVKLMKIQFGYTFIQKVLCIMKVVILMTPKKKEKAIKRKNTFICLLKKDLMKQMVKIGIRKQRSRSA